jgi:sarcosine oxidase subunit gamma|tara:strand:- start:453 stop:1070 length:618 start_codon:yes stop_codon:yes gene_type:complete
MSAKHSSLIEIETPVLRPGSDGQTLFWMQEHAFCVHLNLRGDSSSSVFSEAVGAVTGTAPPEHPNTCVSSEHCRLAWLGPDEWLLIGVHEDFGPAPLEERLAPLHHALTALSGGQTILRVGGENWRNVLASACPFDLHPRVFGEGACAQTVIAYTNVLLMPVEDPDRGEALDIVVRRSFADHLARWLMDAAAEDGFEFLSPVGSP